MRRRVVAVIVAAAIVVVGGITAAIWLSRPTYDDIVHQCAEALKAQHGGGKPNACDGVKQNDYDALNMADAIDDLGWLDDDGNVDMNELLKDATAQP